MPQVKEVRYPDREVELIAFDVCPEFPKVSKVVVFSASEMHHDCDCERCARVLRDTSFSSGDRA